MNEPGQTPLQEAARAAVAGDTAIGKRLPRTGMKRLLAGRGQYTPDMTLPRMLHAALVRSPYAHARIRSIDAAAALAVPGVAHVFTGRDVAKVCVPLLGIARHRAGHKSAPQHAMAVDKAVWQGEPVAAVLAETRAIAEDAAELVAVEWEELPVLVEAEAALAPGAAAIHPDLGDNHAFSHTIKVGDPDKAFADAHAVVEHAFRFDRQTGLTLEPRGLIASYEPAGETLTVYQSHQSPFQMADIYCQHLGVAEHKVRVVTPDVGGGFGTKVNVYGDEVAIAAISKLIGRPVKYCVDRLESFVSDAHSRDHVVTARLAVAADGTMLAMEVDDLAALGAYGMARRFSVAESMMAITNAGVQYRLSHYRARARNAYVNTNLIGMFRGVGVPVACVVTEVLTDMAAARLGMDTVAFKRKNLRRLDEMPYVAPSGIRVDEASYHVCLDRMVEIMGYDRLRREQAELRGRGVWRGIGISTFVEPTAYGPPYYGPSEARISVQDGCTVRLEPTGKIRCVTSITDQGQGTIMGLAQIMAAALGVPVDDVDVIAGDSAISPYGGGAWASRGMAMGGEAALKAALGLRTNILALAGAITQADPKDLDIKDGAVVNRRSGMATIGLGEVGRIGYFRQDTLPPDFDVQLAVTRSHVANNLLYHSANGVTSVHLEVDVDTGFIKLLGIWAVDDCGRVINPMLVDEQVRGGIVHGLGAVLYEHCVYNELGQLQNGTLADYLVPMAVETPDMVIAHVESPERSTLLGAKGIGEAGTIGAMGAVWVAVNDALRPLGAIVDRQPFTPERILDAVRAARSKGAG